MGNIPTMYDIPLEANLHNACNEPCDVIGMPCVCGSWHQPDYYDRRIRTEERRKGEPIDIGPITKPATAPGE